MIVFPVGTAFWSTFPHSDERGFVQHGDGFTFHYPGDDDAMRRFGTQARQISRFGFFCEKSAVCPAFSAEIRYFTK